MTKIKKISENIVEINGERFVKGDSRGWLDIPELSIAVEIEVHDKDKSWNDLNLKNKEEELLTVEQCIWLANSKYSKQLKMDGSSTKDDFFIQQPFNLSRKNGYVAWFFVDSDCAGLYWNGGSDYSYSSLGARFARKILKSSKTKKKS